VIAHPEHSTLFTIKAQEEEEQYEEEEVLVPPGIHL
jgi:hypothetical protein